MTTIYNTPLILSLLPILKILFKTISHCQNTIYKMAKMTTIYNTPLILSLLPILKILFKTIFHCLNTMYKMT